MISADQLGRRILACDDELQILRALKVILREEGYEVQTAANMGEALDVVALSPVDAAIVDLLLPDGDGIELCRRLREWSDMPIIVLSAVGEEEQKIQALRVGADDYMTKPFSPRELVARLEAVLRRASADADESVLMSDGLEIDLAAHVVRRDGEEIHLTRTEYELLRVLVRNRGRLMTHRLLLSEIWGPGYADDTQVLRTHIARLRHKIEPAGSARRHYIRTEPGVGFRFDPR
jgi:two-component system KDP operon response regulator KdpE